MCRELNWTDNTKNVAEELLNEWVTAERPITSLEFKLELRGRVGRMDNITQGDVGYFLRELFLREGYADLNYQAVREELDDKNWHFVYEPLMTPEVIEDATWEDMYVEEEAKEIEVATA